MSKLPRLTCAQLTRAIERLGFVIVRQKGSHRYFRHPETGRRCIIQQHGSKVVPLGTLAHILKATPIALDELLAVL
ncbi:MAG: type II toxin-antitoxin system HicA family toxin [bacterium]|nr:type II toxin-antitoxin system HicA family toxin [bacterium]